MILQNKLLGGDRMQQTLKKEKKDEILNYIKEKRYITNNDFRELDTIVNSKMLERALKYLEEKEEILIKEKKGRANIWRLKEDVVLDKISQKDAINLGYALELSMKEFTLDVQQTIRKILASNDDTITGHLAMFEELKDEKIVKHFDSLKEAIKKRKYLKLKISHSPPYNFDNLKPIRLVFLDNNWYLAFEYSNRDKNDKGFRLGRVAFIESIDFLENNKYSDKNRFQAKDIQKYLNWLDKDIQNSLTFYGVELKVAKIKASKSISRYFKQNMKKFLITQEFQEELEDGTVIFTVKYTNSLEILPFIQRWLPDLIILEPKELRDEYMKKLESTINNHKGD